MSFLEELSKMAKDYGEGLVNQTKLRVPFEYDDMGEDELTKLDNSTNKVYYYKLPYDMLGSGVVFTILGLLMSSLFAYMIYGNIEKSYTYIAEGIPEYVIPLFPLLFVVVGLVTIVHSIILIRAGYKIALILSDDVLYLVDKEGFVTKIERNSIKKAELTKSKNGKKVYYYLRLHYTHPNYEDVVNSTYLLNNIKGGPYKVVDDINQTYGLTSEARTNKVPNITITK